MIERAAMIANLAIFACFAYATYTHFDRDEPTPRGATFVTIAASGGTLANVAVWYAGARAPAAMALFAALLELVSAFVFWAAIASAPKQQLSLSFSDRTPPALVDSGIYAYIRNPLYTSYMIYWLSWVVLTRGHWVSGAFLVLMVGTYVVAALREERLLAARMGEAYRAYGARVKRFVPWVY
ncbi:MAG TPA: isoprenylcysteine carboxylmethyltransferase family protein [Hyphomicrobiaceae bacterium]|nr:isoprenylcysteine carboxylmethyltransferase family protein [Hyphomicrobiaceae bacterium]